MEQTQHETSTQPTGLAVSHSAEALRGHMAGYTPAHVAVFGQGLPIAAPDVYVRIRCQQVTST